MGPSPVHGNVTIPARYNGPVGFGNGGYSCGAFAAAVGTPAEVELRSPVPLDRPLDVERTATNEARVRDDATLVAEVRRIAGLEDEVPGPVGLERSREAAEGYRALSEGLFAHCFVCGPGQDQANGLGVFPGELGEVEGVSTPWRPAPWSADAQGRVRQEIIWAALDCPTYFACFYGVDPYPVSFLASFAVEVCGPVEIGAEYEVSAWRLEVDGRKRRAISAVFSDSGKVLARARALWIEPRGG